MSYFGNSDSQEILQEAEKAKDHFGEVSVLIFHLMKYADPDPVQQSKQGRSWIDSIFKTYNSLTSIKPKNITGNYYKDMETAYINGEILRRVCTLYDKDKLSDKKPNYIPEIYSYQNITNYEWIISYLLTYAHTMTSVRELEKREINISAEVYARCKGH